MADTDQIESGSGVLGPRPLESRQLVLVDLELPGLDVQGEELAAGLGVEGVADVAVEKRLTALDDLVTGVAGVGHEGSRGGCFGLLVRLEFSMECLEGAWFAVVVDVAVSLCSTTRCPREEGGAMRTIDLRETPLSVGELLRMASAETVRIVDTDGHPYLLEEADDFEQEAAQLGRSESFMAFLQVRSEEEGAVSFNPTTKPDMRHPPYDDGET